MHNSVKYVNYQQHKVTDKNTQPNSIHTLMDTWMSKKVHKWITMFVANVSVSANYITSKKSSRWGTDHRMFAYSETRQYMIEIVGLYRPTESKIDEQLILF
jgi:hypothetical protein